MHYLVILYSNFFKFSNFKDLVKLLLQRTEGHVQNQLHSRLYFAHSTRTISAEGCAGTGQIALSPAFRALDTRDLRRGLRAQPRSRLHFAHSTRTISAEGCARTAPIALSPAFRALDARDLRRGLRADRTNRTLACISRTRRARSPQRVARGPRQPHSRLHFARSTRTISAEGCAGTGQIALSPAFCALDTLDLRRGLHADRTLACISRTRRARSPQRVARERAKSHSRLHFAHTTRTISAEGWTSPVQVSHTHTCVLNAYSLGHLPCKFSILTLALHLHTFALGYLLLDAFTLPLTLGYV